MCWLCYMAIIIVWARQIPLEKGGFYDTCQETGLADKIKVCVQFIRRPMQLMLLNSSCFSLMVSQRS